MSALAAPFRWLWGQPYLLLPFTFLFWAGNAIVGRAVNETWPPVLLAQLRWLGAAAIVLPLAWGHLRRDWPAIRKHWLVLAVMAFTGITVFNTLQYTALGETTALNVLLLQSVMPLLIAAGSFALYRDRLTGGQVAGIGVSMLGVLAIVTGGSVEVLLHLRLNPGDAVFLLALAIYAVYSALLKRRPAIHWLSFLAVTVGWGALMLLPATIWEWSTGARPEATPGAGLALAYVVIFPSVLAYAIFNRGVELIGPNRAGPFFHLVPLFGALMAVTLLGEAFTWAHGAGAALIAAGIALANLQRPRGRAQPAAAPPPGGTGQGGQA